MQEECLCDVRPIRQEGVWVVGPYILSTIVGTQGT